MFTLVMIMLVLCIAFAYAAMQKSKQYRESEVELSVKMLSEARVMFPTAENDIVALDLFYQHKYREMLVASKEEHPKYEILKRESIATFNAKNKAIQEAVRFEERFVAPVSVNKIIKFQN